MERVEWMIMSIGKLQLERYFNDWVTIKDCTRIVAKLIANDVIVAIDSYEAYVCSCDFIRLKLKPSRLHHLFNRDELILIL